jgi:hypothetical protein
MYSIKLMLPAALGHEIYSASDRNEYQKQKKISEEKSAVGAKADNFTAICEPIV